MGDKRPIMGESRTGRAIGCPWLPCSAGNGPLLALTGKVGFEFGIAAPIGWGTGVVWEW